VGHVAGLGERRGVCAVLVWKPEGKRPRGRQRRRRESNMKMDIQKLRCGLDRPGSGQGQMAAVMNLRFP